MKSFKIKLSFQEVKAFVNLIGRYAFDADLKSGRFIIDAKSLLGVLSLDLEKPLLLEVHDDNCAELAKELGKYII